MWYRDCTPSEEIKEKAALSWPHFSSLVGYQVNYLFKKNSRSTFNLMDFWFCNGNWFTYLMFCFLLFFNFNKNDIILPFYPITVVQDHLTGFSPLQSRNISAGSGNKTLTLHPTKSESPWWKTRSVHYKYMHLVMHPHNPPLQGKTNQRLS